MLADREVLQLELDRVKASRLHDGTLHRMSTGLDPDATAGGMTRAIVADIETLSLTNAQVRVCRSDLVSVFGVAFAGLASQPTRRCKGPRTRTMRNARSRDKVLVGFALRLQVQQR